MKTLQLLFLTLFLTSYHHSYSQNPYKSLIQSDKYFSREQYKRALVSYLQQDLSTIDELYNYKVGICYLNSADKSKSISYLEKALELDSAYKDLKILLHLASAYQLNHEFDKAKETYQKYILTTPLTEEEKNLINKNIVQCETGKDLINNPVKVKVYNLGAPINSPYDEYSPVLSWDDNTMAFSSNRLSQTSKIDKTSLEYYEEIYVSEKKKKFSTPVNLGAKINSRNYQVPVTITSDGKKIFFIQPTKDNTTDIFVTELSGGEWSMPVSVSELINSPYNETGACISPDGTHLYFASDRPGGLGGTDIYVSNFNKGTWSKPVNLGSVINSTFNEEAPSILADGKTLYFSSDNEQSMGGFDVFKSYFTDFKDRWSTPENLGYPINTAADEVHISWSSAEKKGYYSVDRPDSFGGADIYCFEYIEESKKQELSPLVTHNPKFHKKNLTKEEIVLVNTFHTISNEITVGKRGLMLSHVVHFPFNVSKTITEYSMKKVTRVIEILNENKNLTLIITGYADGLGNKEINEKLSKERAQTVYDYIVSKGIDPSRLECIGLGYSDPITNSKKVSKNVVNRRVEFQIINKDTSLANYQ